MLFLSGVNYKVKGLGNINREEGYLYMCNHNSFFDHFLVVIQIPHFAVGIEKAANFKVPVYGALSRWWGNIPIVRTDPVEARKSIEMAQKVLSSGVSIGMAPEGTRSDTGKVGVFKKGGFHLAKNAGGKIIPVSILGMKEVNPDKIFKIIPGEVEVIFHKPIDSSEYEIDELVCKVRSQICSVGLEAE